MLLVWFLLGVLLALFFRNSLLQLLIQLSITLRIHILFFCIVKRGIVNVSVFWWRVSDWIMNPHLVTNVYRALRRTNQPVYKTHLLGQAVTVVLDRSLMKHILELSPECFGPGKYKANLFSQFMLDNLGISIGREWAMRRQQIEGLLHTKTSMALFHSQKAATIQEILRRTYTQADPRNWQEFADVAVGASSEILFGRPVPEAFVIFEKLNSLRAVWFRRGQVSDNPQWVQIVDDAIQNSRSLIYQLQNPPGFNVYDQVPHFLFPLNNVLASGLARLLYLLTTTPSVSDKLTQTLAAFSCDASVETITTIPFLRYVILENLRLSTPVQTYLRQALEPIQWHGTEIHKKEELIMLGAPFLRDPEYFPKPHEFVPERWRDKQLVTDSMLMFGWGGQRCPFLEYALEIGGV